MLAPIRPVRTRSIATRYGKRKPPRTGASWVDVKRLAALPNSGIVRVARGGGRESRGCKIEVELRAAMKDVEPLVGDPNDVARRRQEIVPLGWSYEPRDCPRSDESPCQVADW